ncbi:MAG: efflux transporter outer membrane subunit [Rubrivivax sp.]|nr:efflux transporter outer membrane subunit [Rubrivivax sp.]
MSLPTAKVLVVAAAAALLAGCMNLAPRYERPPAPVPGEWPAGGAAGTPATAQAATARPEGAAADIAWQAFFADERLRELIALALASNRDLRLAALNVERARALHGIERADRWPTIDATGAAHAGRTPASLSPTGAAATTKRYDANIGITAYELDFFGRVKNLEGAALQQFLAAGQARRSVQISLVAEVAGAYLRLAADRERLQLARDTLANQESAYTLIRRRVEAGAGSQLDLRRAQTTVDAARADVARYTGTVAQDENTLALLVGAPLPAGLLPPALAPVASIAELPSGVPAEVLRRRPDIRRAEHQLQAANAHIGAARAAFFPSISLTAAGGVASDALSGLFQGGAGAWSFLPRITLPIFDGGRNQARLDVASVDRDIALAAYERAIQAAFREVADALAERGTLGERLAAQQSLVEASVDSHRLSDIRFREGVESYLAVLDAQRATYAAQQELIGVRLARLANQVTVYKVLGGGWSEADDRVAEVAPR